MENHAIYTIYLCEERGSSFWSHEREFCRLGLMVCGWLIDMKTEYRTSLDDAENIVQSGFDWYISEEQCAIPPVWKTMNFTSVGG
jgi:hypothetical protein